MTTHVYFDLDGTLTDPYEGITRCILYALDELGFPRPDDDYLYFPRPDDDYLYSCIGPPLWDTFPELVGQDLTRKAVDLYRERFLDTGWKENKPYDGIVDALETVASAT
jgi:phosphoglycolate phosphatase